MTTVLVVGAGAIGTRAGHELGSVPGIERFLVADRRRERADALRRHLGSRAEVGMRPVALVEAKHFVLRELARCEGGVGR